MYEMNDALFQRLSSALHKPPVTSHSETPIDSLWLSLQGCAYPKANLSKLRAEDLVALLNLGIQSFRASYTQRLSFNEHGRNLSLLCRSITNVAGQNSISTAKYHDDLQQILRFLLEMLESVDTSRKQHLDILRAMNALLHERASEITQPFLPELIGQLNAIIAPQVTHMTPFCGSVDVKLELDRKRMAVNCVVSIFYKINTKHPNYHLSAFGSILELMETLVQHYHALMKESPMKQEEILVLMSALSIDSPKEHEHPLNSAPVHAIQYALCKLIVSGLRALHILLQEQKSLVDAHNSGQIFKYIYRLALTPRLSDSTHSSLYKFGYSAYAAASRANSFLNSKYVPPHLRQQQSDGSRAIVSESEFSDASETCGRSKHGQEESKIREQALILLQTLVSSSGKWMFQYWPLLFHEKVIQVLNSSTQECWLSIRDMNLPSLFTLIIWEQDERIRFQATVALKSILQNAKPFLVAAAEPISKKQASFVSLAEKMLDMVIALHRLLSASITKEHNTAVLLELLQAVTILAVSVDYQRLQSQLFISLMQPVVNRLLQEPNEDLKLALVEGLASLIDLIVHDDQLKKRRQDFLNQFMGDKDSVFLKLIEISNQSAALCVNSMAALKALVHICPELMIANYNDVDTIIAKAFLQEESKSDGTSEDSVEVALKVSAMNLIIAFMSEAMSSTKSFDTKWWITIIDWYIQKAASAIHQTLRSLACEGIASIPGSVFVNLPQRTQILCITLLLGLIEDHSALVRTSACRAVGVLISIRQPQLNIVFLNDAFETCLKMFKDGNMNVRARATWAFANCTDTLVHESLKNGIDNIEDEASLPVGFLFTLLIDGARASLSLNQANEKMHPNILRAIGNILRLLPSDFLLKEMNALVKDCLMLITHHMTHGMAKIRWNANHALAVALKNPYLPIGLNNRARTVPVFTESVLNAISDVLCKCKNFKVKLHACQALMLMKSRNYFIIDQNQGQSVHLMIKICTSLVDLSLSLKNVQLKESEDKVDPHLHHLISQVETVLEHMFSLMTESEKMDFREKHGTKPARKVSC